MMKRTEDEIGKLMGVEPMGHKLVKNRLVNHEAAVGCSLASWRRFV